MIYYRTNISKERSGLNKHRYILTLEKALFGLYGWRYISSAKSWKFWRWQDARREERRELKLAFIHYSIRALWNRWRRKAG